MSKSLCKKIKERLHQAGLKKNGLQKQNRELHTVLAKLKEEFNFINTKHQDAKSKLFNENSQHKYEKKKVASSSVT